MDPVKSIGQCKKPAELCKTGLVMKHQGWGKTCPACTYYYSDSLVPSKQQNLFNGESLEIAHILCFKVNCTL